MKRLRPFAPLASLFALLGCSNADGSLLILSNQIVEPKDNCQLMQQTMFFRTSGTLDLGLVELGGDGYYYYPTVKNNLVDRSGSTGGFQYDNVVLQGFDVELLVTGELAARLPGSQRKYFQPVFGGTLAPGQSTAVTALLLPRQIALALAPGITGNEPQSPTVTIRHRAVGKRGDDTLTSLWHDYPVRLCRFCLTQGEPRTCPAMGVTADAILNGGCNPSQDSLITCCRTGDNVLCGAKVPKAMGM